MAKRYDAIVIGTGNAGMATAGVARAAGKTVAIVESWDVGGTCPLRGCVPKKVLVAAAQALHQIALAPAHKIAVGPARLDWGALIARERGFVEGMPARFTESLTGRGIDIVRGRARFVGRDKIQVGDRVLQGGKIVIATGSTPRPLSIPGAEHLIVSDDILEMAELPERLVFIGGGTIALEFAHVLARAGTEVTILEALPRLLPRNDADAVARVHKESERIGIAVLTGVEVAGIEKSGAALTVRFRHDGKDKTLTADKIANGTGRVPDLDGLDLAAGEIAHDGTRVTVDAALRSVSNPDVFVGGDALWSSAQLSPVATYEGKLIGKTIATGEAHAPDYASVPSAVYTVPALATVGLSEDAAREASLKFAAKTNDMQDWLATQTQAETVAFSKVLVEEGSDRILGAHIVGHGAEEIVHIFAFAMAHGVTAKALADTVYAYPTYSADIKHMV